MTCSRLPDVSPFVQSVLRVRLKNVAKPVRRVDRERLLVHEADHQDLVRLVVLNHGRNQSVQLAEVHLPAPRKKKTPPVRRGCV